MTMNVPNIRPQGWQCPVCLKVHAPWVAECDCHLRKTIVPRITDPQWGLVNYCTECDSSYPANEQHVHSSTPPERDDV